MYPEKVKIIGWREWVGLPELGIEKIKAKIDTGARTSTLHAFDLKFFKKKGKEWVTFKLHPKQRREDIVVQCVCELFDVRLVSDSGGHRAPRYIIKTPLVLGKETWPIEITLATRGSLRFRMLLGRSAIKGKYVVDCAQSYVMGRL